MKRISGILLLMFLFCAATQAQKKNLKVVQFSGYAVTSDSLIGVPFVHITVLHTGRVATAGVDGFFSLPVLEGDTLYFTSVGYKTSEYIVPKGLADEKFWAIQLMTRSERYLHETVILPWRREDFHQVFMNTHPPKTDLERAQENLERERLAAMGEKLERDADEATEQNLRERSAQTYYYGQVPPQNIFNPLAWAEFIQAWKRGDFKNSNNNNNNNNNSNSDNNNDGQ